MNQTEKAALAWSDKVLGAITRQALYAGAQIVQGAGVVTATSVNHARQVADHAAKTAFAIAQGRVVLALDDDASMQQPAENQQQRFGDQPGQHPFHEELAFGVLVLVDGCGDVAPDQYNDRWRL